MTASVYGLAMKIFTTLLTFGLLCSCTTGKPPIYGPRSCIDDDGKNIGYAPYTAPNSNTVTCLPAEAAVFMMCVRELSVESLTDSRTSQASVTLPSVKSEPVSTTGGGMTTTNKADVTVHFDDKLSEARADAIRKCIEVSNVARAVTASAPAIPSTSTAEPPAAPKP